MHELGTPQLDAIFHALADPTRRAILGQLAERVCSVTELAKPHPISLAAISKHLKILEKAGLLTRTKQGRHYFCELAPDYLLSAGRWLQSYEQMSKRNTDILDKRGLESSLPEILAAT